MKSKPGNAHNSGAALSCCFAILLLLLSACSKERETICQVTHHNFLGEQRERLFFYNDEHQLLQMDEYSMELESSNTIFSYNKRGQWIEAERWFIGLTERRIGLHKAKMKYVNGKLQEMKFLSGNNSQTQTGFILTEILQYEYQQDGSLSTIRYFTVAGVLKSLLEILEVRDGNITKSRKTNFNLNNPDEITSVLDQEFDYDDFLQLSYPDALALLQPNDFNWWGFSKNNLIISSGTLLDAEGNFLSSEVIKREFIYDEENRVVGFRSDESKEVFTYDCYE